MLPQPGSHGRRFPWRRSGATAPGHACLCLRMQPMMRHNRRVSIRAVQVVVYALLVSLLASAPGWTLGTAIAHELDHELRVVSPAAISHWDAHAQNGSATGDLDETSHQFLHAAGQAQSSYLGHPALVFAPGGGALPTLFISSFAPESVPDSPLRPPKTRFAS